jgi:hypothetical protein
MYVDKKGIPYIATYYTAQSDDVTQYFLIYKEHTNWKTIQITQRETPFSLKGKGSRKIPISRPQILVDDRNHHTRVILVYRDIEYDNKITIAVNQDSDFKNWDTRLISHSSVGSWEPSYDTELWKKDNRLHLFVQHVGQGDGEKLENIPAQNIEIQEIKIE